MRTRAVVVSLVSSVVIGVLATGCVGSEGRADAPPTPTAPVRLTVLHTNDLWGETNPCG